MSKAKSEKLWRKDPTYKLQLTYHEAVGSKYRMLLRVLPPRLTNSACAAPPSWLSMWLLGVLPDVNLGRCGTQEDRLPAENLMLRPCSVTMMSARVYPNRWQCWLRRTHLECCRGVGDWKETEKEEGVLAVCPSLATRLIRRKQVLVGKKQFC